MEKRTNSPYPRIDRPVLALIGVALVVSTALFAWSDFRKDWRYYQDEFRGMVAEKFGEDKAEALPKGIQQAWLPDLRRADRCITCHQGINWKGFETAEHPFKSHPQAILKAHPVEKFGCTTCHGGQGYAVTFEESHGPIKHWEEPVLGSFLGEAYSLVESKRALMEINCNICHRYDRQTAGASEINLAKAVVREKGCRACHVINGRGGTIGPDLTFVGDKAAEQYEYGRLSGQKSTFAWHAAHFKDPRALVPETVMPNFNLTTRQTQALSMLMMSWRKVTLPATYRPDALRTDPQTAEEIAEEEQMRTGPGAWFVKTGCFVCHSLSVFGVKSPAQIGPDLSTAVEDVQSRFGKTLPDFLDRPEGTMAVVLTRQIILSPQEKQIAVQKLREAFAEYQRRKASAVETAQGAAQ